MVWTSTDSNMEPPAHVPVRHTVHRLFWLARRHALLLELNQGFLAGVVLGHHSQAP